MRRAMGGGEIWRRETREVASSCFAIDTADQQTQCYYWRYWEPWEGHCFSWPVCYRKYIRSRWAHWDFCRKAWWSNGNVSTFNEIIYVLYLCVKAYEFKDKETMLNLLSSSLYEIHIVPSLHAVVFSWQYYKYVLETPYALTGSHNLAKATAKGNTVILFVASATDKQWPASQKTLKAMLDSFQV